MVSETPNRETSFVDRRRFVTSTPTSTPDSAPDESTQSTSGVEVAYKTTTVQCVRGMEARTIAKMQAEGWELVGQQTHLVRSKITFRRPKKPVQRWVWAAAGAGALALVAIIVTGTVLERSPRDEASSAPPTPTTTTPVEPTEDPSASPSATATSTPVAPAAPSTLTVENSPALASLLAGSDSDWDAFARFASENRGATLSFDAHIVAIAPYEGYETRFNILILNGDFAGGAASGPPFQFRDVGIVDLGLSGSNVPDSLTVGLPLRVTAKLQSYNSDQGIILLDPVTTTVR